MPFMPDLGILDGKTVLAIWIVAIGLFIIGLWLATYVLWRAGQAQHRAIADAAQSSARAAILAAQNIAIVERAYMHPVILKENIRAAIKAVTEQSDTNRQWPFVQFRFKNYGKTAAFITDIKATVVCWTGTPIAPDDFEEFFPSEAVIQPGQETEEFSAWVRTPLAAIEAEQIKNGSGQVYFFGHINFEDVWGEHRSAPFYRMWDAARGKFVPYTPDPGKHSQTKADGIAG
jgi:hypothetical protein